MKGGKKGKRKGNKNERKLAAEFKEWWGKGEWARTPLSGGWSSKSVREGFRTCGDIITTAEDFPFCVEGKHQEGWELIQLLSNPNSILYKFWDQAVEQTPSGLIPLLVVHRNYRESLVITRESVFCGTVLECIHLVLRNADTQENLVIFKLSDLFLINPALFGRSEDDVQHEAETGFETGSQVPEV